MLNRYFDDIIDTIALDPFTPMFANRKNIRSSFDGRVNVEGDNLSISFDVPGVKKTDVDVTFEAGSTIKVVARRYDTNATSTWRYVVPQEWDRESADAKLEDGVLSIALTKKIREETRKLFVK